MRNSIVWTQAALALGIFTAAVTGCTSDSTESTVSEAAGTASSDAEVTKVKDQFWDAFTDARVDDVVAARAAMLGLLETHPNDPELARWIGFSTIVPLAAAGTAGDQGAGGGEDGAQAEGPPGGGGAAKMDESMAEAVKYTKLAMDVSADARTRTYNSDFYAGMIYSQGNAQNDPAQVEEGRRILEQVTKEIPAFGFLSRGDIMLGSPKGSPDFDLAVESYFRFYEQCTGTKIDREHPDLSAILRRPFADADSTCTNWAHAPHSIQGSLLNFADALVKQGKIEAAKPIYAIIPRTEGFESWKFASVVDERLGSDLVARAAQYGKPGANPRDEPRLGAGCFGCHQR